MKEVLKGIIVSFNGKFGFVKFEKGLAFFHKSFVPPELLPNIEKGVAVTFKVQPSKKKLNSWEVTHLYDIVEPEKNSLTDDKKEPKNVELGACVGRVKFFNITERFGFLTNSEGDYYVSGKKLKNTDYLII